MTETLEFDYVIVGSGSGLDLANALAENNSKVAVIEKDKPGGTCLNRGCIPSKFLIHSSDVLEKIKNSNKFGIDITDYSLNASSMFQKTNNFTDSQSDALLNGLSKQTNPRFFHNEAKFVSKNTLQVGNYQITSPKIILATGSKPKIPEIEGLNKVDFLTSSDALRLSYKPKSMTIIGGGYIGCEFAHFFGTLGTEINIIHTHDNLLNKEDKDVSESFTKIMKKKYNIFPSYYTKKISKENDEYTIYAESKSGDILEIKSEQLLITIGRIPNTDSLQVEKSGIELDKGGYVKVNEFLETTQKGIFALGDVLKNQPFKHAANYETKCIYTTLSGSPYKVDYSVMPRAIFCSPQIASVGKTEQELSSENTKYKKLIQKYSDTAMGKIIEEEHGFVKLLVDENNEKILGAHILGHEASILIHEIIVAMNTP
ncbi:MAG: dihydrolipoyl dehydrogenase, partial [Nitrosopumilaceae archaeon]|nr:dihydrolipoyl dehydrogenase [Nitrosopumilaceae archaeon]